MTFCTNCGNENGNDVFCTSCGHKVEASLNATAKVQTAKPVLVPPTLATLKNSSIGNQLISSKQSNKKKVIIGASAAALVLCLIIVGAATAKHWVKIDVAEHAETFHAETYATGNYDVTDDHDSPCWVGEDYTSCINSHIDIYNLACTTVPLSAQGSSECSSYLTMINNGKAQAGYGRYGWTVTSTSSAGYLIQSPETATKQVSNNDYIPAVTHKAVCYFGFLGECEK